MAAALRRTGVPFGVSSIAQAAAIASLDAADDVAGPAAAVAAERDRWIARCALLGYVVPRSYNFARVAHHRRRTRAVALSAFDAADILVRGYAGDGNIVDASNDRVIRVLAGLAQAAA